MSKVYERGKEIKRSKRQDRLLAIFLRAMLDKCFRVDDLLSDYGVSEKTIFRDISIIRCFLADYSDGLMSLEYDRKQNCYRMAFKEFLSNKELFALCLLVIGCGAFPKDKLRELVNKLLGFTAPMDKTRIRDMIRRAIHEYPAERQECGADFDMLWRLGCSVADRREISIDYSCDDNTVKTYRCLPILVKFKDMLFYLVATVSANGKQSTEVFRVNRIRKIEVPKSLPASAAGPAADGFRGVSEA